MFISTPLRGPGTPASDPWSAVTLVLPTSCSSGGWAAPGAWAPRPPGRPPWDTGRKTLLPRRGFWNRREGIVCWLFWFVVGHFGGSPFGDRGCGEEPTRPRRAVRRPALRSARLSAPPSTISLLVSEMCANRVYTTRFPSRHICIYTSIYIYRVVSPFFPFFKKPNYRSNTPTDERNVLL